SRQQAKEQEEIAKEQEKIAKDRSQLLEDRTKKLQETLADLDSSKKQADKNATEAVLEAKQAAAARASAEGETKRANTALLQATVLRLAAEGQAAMSQARPGITLQGVLQVLAAHRTEPGVEPYFAMQSITQLLSLMERLLEGTGTIPTVVFRAYGKRIVAGGGDTSFRLWYADSGKSIGERLRGHSDWVWSVAFSPDGKRIVSGGRDNSLRLWD